jgi:hypothetical protein
MSRASGPVQLIPLVQQPLRAAGLYTRDRSASESTEFSMTRFLVPHLAGYHGDALFMDCDMLCLADIYELVEHVHQDRSERAIRRVSSSGDVRSASAPAVWVCPHEYETTATVKFLGQINLPYPRKNWSSLMYFDCDRCGMLNPARVNILSGIELHRFAWLDDDRLGTLPLEWNWLVGEYVAKSEVKNVHFTLGGPWFPETAACDYADRWFIERAAMLHPCVLAPELI